MGLVMLGLRGVGGVRYDNNKERRMRCLKDKNLNLHVFIVVSQEAFQIMDVVKSVNVECMNHFTMMSLGCHD